MSNSYNSKIKHIQSRLIMIAQLMFTAYSAFGHAVV